MYICHALINAMSARIIHCNLNAVFYTHIEDSMCMCFIELRKRFKF